MNKVLIVGLSVPLSDLAPGSVFSHGSTMAVKSQYKYNNDPAAQSLCVSLKTGEFVHLPDRNKTMVVLVVLPWSRGD